MSSTDSSSPQVSDYSVLPDSLRDSPPLAFRGNNIFINGSFVKTHSNLTFDTYRPDFGKVAISLPDADQQDVDDAVKAAYSSRKMWGGMRGSDRATYLEKVADLIKKKYKRFSIIESFDAGKPLRESEADMSDVISAFKFNAQLAIEFDREQEEPIGDQSGDLKNRVRYEPYGVAALITPWNYPLLMAVQKVAAALAAGCTCVLKPSEYASLTCIELAECIREADFPRGVFNLVTGYGATTGDALVKHPLVRKISFTGSVPTGRIIMKNAADCLKPVHLELGGKSPMIVFDDVDKKAVVDWIMAGIFWSSGQICSATSRVMIHKNIYKELCDMLKEETKKLKVGGFDDPQVPNVGPLISQQQYQRVLHYIEEAKKVNLNVLIGGEVERPQNLTRGYFVQPTIYYDVPKHSKLWTEEIFGPVLCVRPFETEEEAVEEANNTEYGLGAAVMTGDATRGKRVVEALEAGVVWENCSQPVAQDLPFGGYKFSGFGRECGKAGFMEYLQMKTITSCHTSYNSHTFVQ